MGPSEGFFVFLTVAVVVGTVASLVKTLHRNSLEARAGSGEVAELLRRVERLEERVGNIETIVVGVDKARQFDALAAGAGCPTGRRS